MTTAQEREIQRRHHRLRLVIRREEYTTAWEILRDARRVREELQEDKPE